jgi:hypothetical protein
MKRKASDQQISLCSLIFIIPIELLMIIASFLDTESQMALACTGKKLYGYYKKQCKEQTFTFLYNTKTKDANIHKCLKAFEHHMGRVGWEAIKVNLKLALVNPQNNYKHPIKALYYKITSKYPMGMDETSLSAFILDLDRHKESHQPNVDLFAKFSNLKLLSLHNAILTNDMILAISKLRLLEFISLYNCRIFSGHLTNAFKNLTNLQEVQILFCIDFDFVASSIELPPLLKSFEMQQPYYRRKVDASFCIQLECL